MVCQAKGVITSSRMLDQTTRNITTLRAGTALRGATNTSTLYSRSRPPTHGAAATAWAVL